VFDEVQAFGYLGGELFAAARFGVTPDIICLGKALGSGAPIAATVMRGDFRSLLWRNEAEFTNGGQPPACAAAHATLDVLDRVRDEIARNGEAFAKAGQRLRHTVSNVNVRRIGFSMTICRIPGLRYPREWTREIVKRAYDRGLLLRSTNDERHVLLKPPVIIKPDVISRSFDTLTDVILSVDRDLSRAPTTLDEKIGPHAPLTRVKKPIKPNPNSWYVRRLLAHLGSGFNAVLRTGHEQQHLSAELRSAGINAQDVYANEDGTIEYTFTPGDSLDIVLPRFSKAERWKIEGLVQQHQAFVERAHDVGHVVADRWPGNAIADTRGNITWIDFDIAYTGDKTKLMIFEELFALFQCLAFIQGRELIANLARRICPRIEHRFGRSRIEDVWVGMRSFYSNPEKPSVGSSLPPERYAVVVGAFDMSIGT
jgi:hypothetical protein